MSISISIDQRCMKLVEGSYRNGCFNITGFSSMSIPENTLTRGLHEDENILLEQMQLFLRQYPIGHKAVDLMLCSNSLITKIVELPVMNKKQMTHCVQQELAEFVNDEGKYLYDYYVIEEKGNIVKILCAALEIELVNKIREIAKKLGVALQSVDVAYSAPFKLMNEVKEMDQGAYIVGILRSKELDLYLYDDGEYIQYSKKNLQGRENLGMITEVTQAISSMGQYVKTRHRGKEVKGVYLAGLHDKEMEYCNNISNAVGVPTKPLQNEAFKQMKAPEDFNVCSFCYATLNLNRK